MSTKKLVRCRRAYERFVVYPGSMAYLRRKAVEFVVLDRLAMANFWPRRFEIPRQIDIAIAAAEVSP